MLWLYLIKLTQYFPNYAFLGPPGPRRVFASHQATRMLAPSLGHGSRHTEVGFRVRRDARAPPPVELPLELNPLASLGADEFVRVHYHRQFVRIRQYVFKNML